MRGVWAWGLDLIRSVQTVHGTTLDVIFKSITFLGEEEFFLILLPLIFWCVDWAVGVRLTCIFLLSTDVNLWLKGMIEHPRPFELDPVVKLHDASGYGLPSGHAQSSVVVWGFLASCVRKWWAWIAAILLMCLIGFSRIYLGVHFPTDVLGGWVVGAFFLAGFLTVLPYVESWLKKASLGVQLALAVFVPLLLVLVFVSDSTISAMGALMGAGVGMVLMAHWSPFSTGGPFWQRAVRFLVGAVGLLAVRFGLKAVFPGEGEAFYQTARFVRYVVLGLWTGLGGPWLFLKLRLASKK